MRSIITNLRDALKAADSDEVGRLLKDFHDAARALHMEIELPADSTWGRQLASARADVADVLEGEIDPVSCGCRRTAAEAWRAAAAAVRAARGCTWRARIGDARASNGAERAGKRQACQRNGEAGPTFLAARHARACGRRRIHHQPEAVTDAA